MKVFQVYAKSGEEMNAYLELLERQRSSPRAAAVV
jgi:hypothetical protein